MFRDVFICVVVFACGWALMAVEILGGRMLGPYFGSDIYVWGSVISVFLLALSIGYFLGGLLSQRIVAIWTLMCIIAGAGILIALLPLYYGAVADRLWNVGPRCGPLSASAILFLPPSVLLGMVSPYAIRLSTRTVASVGMKSGVLYAVSTVGSFLGSLVTAFYFIGQMGIKNILYFHGALLIAVAVAGLALRAACGPPTDTERTPCAEKQNPGTL